MSCHHLQALAGSYRGGRPPTACLRGGEGSAIPSVFSSVPSPLSVSVFLSKCIGQNNSKYCRPVYIRLLMKSSIIDKVRYFNQLLTDFDGKPHSLDAKISVKFGENFVENNSKRLDQSPCDFSKLHGVRLTSLFLQGLG